MDVLGGAEFLKCIESCLNEVRLGEVHVCDPVLGCYVALYPQHEFRVAYLDFEACMKAFCNIFQILHDFGVSVTIIRVDNNV